MNPSTKVNPIAPPERYGPARPVLVFTTVGPGVVFLDSPLPGVLFLERRTRTPQQIAPANFSPASAPMPERIRYERMEFSGLLEELRDWEEWGTVHHDPRAREDWLFLPIFVQDGIFR